MTRTNPVSLSSILYKSLKEDSGDMSGAKTFQGGPFGQGGIRQIPAHEFWPGLHDREKEEREEANPNLPTDMPKDELYDLLEPEHGSDAPTYMAERHGSDILYRDMPGFPRMNTLVNKVNHIPDDEEDGNRDMNDPNLGDKEASERYAQPNLLPTPREDSRGVPFGHGKYTPADELALNVAVNGPSDVQDQLDAVDDTNPNDLNDLHLASVGTTKKQWDQTRSETDKGSTNRDVKSTHLVKPVNWIQKEFGQQDYKKKFEEEDDVPLEPGRMANLAHPVKHVPGDVNIYSKSPGYMQETTQLHSYLYHTPITESRKSAMSTKKTTTKDKMPTKQKTEDFLPDDIDKKLPTEPYGNGIGSILMNYKFRPEDTKELKTVEPVETENPQVPYSPGDDKFLIIVQTKLFDKLSKLASKDSKDKKD